MSKESVEDKMHDQDMSGISDNDDEPLPVGVGAVGIKLPQPNLH